jgi:hypothetical protein
MIRFMRFRLTEYAHFQTESRIFWHFQFNAPQRRRRGIVLREPCSAGVPPGAGTGGETPPALAAGDGRATPARSLKIFSAGCCKYASPAGFSN